MEKLYCMIIGDIISSKKIETNTRANIQIALKQTLEKINFDYDKYICSKFCITLGDELQGGLYTIYPLFDILNRIKQCISPYKIRFGIGIDTMTTEIQYYNSLASDGLAYYYARNAIENLKQRSTNEYGYQFGSSISNLDYANDLISLVDCISCDWTKTQKDYIAKLQNNHNLEISTIAKSMNVNVSSVSRAIAKSNYRLVEKVLINLIKKINNEIFISELQNEFHSKYNQACELIDKQDFKSAKKILCSPITNDEYINYYSLLATIYNAERNSEKAIEYANKAISALDSNYLCKKIRLLNILGICYTDIGNYDLAIKCFSEAKQLLDISDSVESWQMYTLGNEARLYSKIGNFSDAESLFKQVLKILNTSFQNDTKSLITLESNLGKLYHRWQKYDISLKMFESAINLSELVNEKHSNTNAMLKYNLAELLMDISNSNFMDVYSLLLEAAETFKKNGISSRLISCYKLLCDLCRNAGENIKATEFENKIQKLEEENNVSN